MNDINEMPPKCQYCPYWEVCEYPWVCPDRERLATNLQPTCSATDTISRQSALNVLNKLDVSDGVGISSVACCLQEEAIRSIENLPSVQPERRKGRWRKGVCECGYDWAKDAPISSVPNFCINCGADMREVSE